MRTPGRPKTPWRRAAIVLVPLVLALTLADGWLRKRFGPVTTQLLVFGGLAMSVVFSFLILGTHRRDAVIARAVRTARAGRWEEGVARLRQALAEAPSGERYAALAALLGQKRQWLESAAMFERAYQSEPAKTVHLMSRCVMLVEAGKREEAIQLIRGARAAAPGESALAYAEAIVLAESGRMEDAVAALMAGEALDRERPGEQTSDRASRAALLKLASERLSGVPRRS